MITLKKLLAEKRDAILELASALGFNEPRLYKAIYPEPKDYLYLLVESSSDIVNESQYQLNEWQRVRYLELLLEKELNCTVIIRTKSTLVLNLTPNTFNALEKEAKLLTEDSLNIITYYGGDITFNKVKNIQVEEEELLDTETLNYIEKLKEEIKKIKGTGISSIERNRNVQRNSRGNISDAASVIPSFSKIFSSPIELPEAIQRLQDITNELQEKAKDFTPATQRKCVAIVQDLFDQLKNVLDIKENLSEPSDKKWEIQI